MSRLIDHALLLALLVTMVGFIARIPSLVVDAVLMGAMTPVADALEHVLRMSTWRKG
jgi:biopolymer transport protein ExbB/TolQ